MIELKAQEAGDDDADGDAGRSVELACWVRYTVCYEKRRCFAS
jgi:hypothetical protein